jgi:hypothetical protein
MAKRIRKNKIRQSMKNAKDAFKGVVLLGLGALAGCGGDTHNHYYSADAGANKPDATLPDSEQRSDAMSCSLSYSTKCDNKKNTVRCVLLPGKSVEMNGLSFRYHPKEEGNPEDWFDVVDLERGCAVVGKVEFRDIPYEGPASEANKMAGSVTVYGRTYVVTLHKFFEIQDQSTSDQQSMTFAFDVEITRINGDQTCEDGIVGPIVKGKLNLEEKLNLNTAMPSEMLGLKAVKLSDVSRLSDGTKEISVHLVDQHDNVIGSLVLDNDSMTIVKVGEHNIVIEVRDAFVGDTFNEKSAVLAIYGC